MVGRAGYLVKAPGEDSGNNKGIPVQDKVRNLKRIEEEQRDINFQTTPEAMYALRNTAHTARGGTDYSGLQ